MSYSYDDLVKAYRKLGVEKGRVVYVGASLPYLREFEIPGKAALLNAHYNVLVNLLGEDGTIVVFTQSTSLCNTDTPFDVNKTQSISGIFSEYIRKKEGAFRSFHPFSSYAAIGKYAKKIMQDVGRHAFGAETPMARMIALDALSISIGLPPRLTCSTIHQAELVLGVPYRYTKEFEHPVVRDGKIVKELFYLYVLYRECNIKRNSLVKIFEKFSAQYEIKSVDVGKGQIYSYSMAEFYSCVIKLIKDDTYIWLDEIPEIKPYRK